MADADAQGMRATTAAPIAFVRLHSLSAAQGPVASSTPLFDAFAAVFARMSQSVSEMDPAERPPQDRDQVEPIASESFGVAEAAIRYSQDQSSSLYDRSELPPLSPAIDAHDEAKSSAGADDALAVDTAKEPSFPSRQQAAETVAAPVANQDLQLSANPPLEENVGSELVEIAQVATTSHDHSTGNPSTVDSVAEGSKLTPAPQDSNIAQLPSGEQDTSRELVRPTEIEAEPGEAETRHGHTDRRREQLGSQVNRGNSEASRVRQRPEVLASSQQPTQRSADAASSAMEGLASPGLLARNVASPQPNSTVAPLQGVVPPLSRTEVRSSRQTAGSGLGQATDLNQTFPLGLDSNSGSARSSGSAQRQRTHADVISRIKLIQRVTKAFQHLGPDGGTVRLRLAPAELGSVRVEMQVRDRKVKARVVAETEAASSALREHLPDLRARLESYGMQVERIEVETEATNRGSDDNQQAESRWQPPQQQHRSRSTQAGAGQTATHDDAANSSLPLNATSGILPPTNRGVDVRL